MLRSSRSTPTRFGSQIYSSDDTDRALALLAGCGGTAVRIGLNGDLDFSDALCAAAAGRGMRIVLLSPAYAQPVDVNKFAADVAALHQRYARYDPAWEIWNEPNLSFYWGAPANVADYSKLAIATGKALRAVGANEIWSGGTSGIDVSWIYQMKVLGVFDVMNGCAVHSYDEPCAAYNQYGQILNMLPAGVRIHTTETCVPSSKSAGDQADFLRQMWYLHRNIGLPTMIWCELRDGTAGKTGLFAFPYGLLYANYAPKPSYLIAKNLIAP